MPSPVDDPRDHLARGLVDTDRLLELGELRTVHIDDIKPYWRNPRRVTEDVVNQLVESIKRYGYNQPIVVDAELVIIVGHTRYAALRRMDVTRVPVLVAADMSAKDAKQYRLIDNRVAELTSWDFEKLAGEIEGLDQGIATMFFPELAGGTEIIVGLDERIAREWDRVIPKVDFVCPSCFHSFSVEVSKEQIMTGTIDSTAVQEATA